MAISYNRLWKRLIDHDLSKTDMMHRANISTNVLARLGKGRLFQWKAWKNLQSIKLQYWRCYGICS